MASADEEEDEVQEEDPNIENKKRGSHRASGVVGEYGISEYHATKRGSPGNFEQFDNQRELVEENHGKL